MLMNGLDDPNLGKASVGDLFRHQGLRHDSDHVSAPRQGRVRKGAHESDPCTAIHHA